MAVIQYMAIIINNHGVGFIFFLKNYPPIIQLVRFLMVEPAHQDWSPRLSKSARIFLDLFQD